jgi:hypothetical protein
LIYPHSDIEGLLIRLDEKEEGVLFQGWLDISVWGVFKKQNPASCERMQDFVLNEK